MNVLCGNGSRLKQLKHQSSRVLDLSNFINAFSIYVLGAAEKEIPLIRRMNIGCELLIYMLSVLAVDLKHHHYPNHIDNPYRHRHRHHHHHHHGNGLGHVGRHRKRSRSKCARRILEAIRDSSSYENEHSVSPLSSDDGLALVLPPGAKKSPSNTDFLITEATPENRPNAYTPVYSNSKVYEITAKKDTDVSFVFVSTTEKFFPQLKISKSAKKECRFKEATPFFSGPNSTKSYQVKKGEVIAVEIGYDSKLDTSPFSTVKKGGFNLIVSQSGKTLENYLEKNKIEIWDPSRNVFSGTVTYTNGSPLSLSAGFLPNLNHGTFDIKLTPYYDSKKNSISLYYHKGSDKFISGTYRSSTIEQYCKRDADPTKSAKGSEPRTVRYFWKVPSRKVCDFTDFLKEFN